MRNLPYAVLAASGWVPVLGLFAAAAHFDQPLLAVAGTGLMAVKLSLGAMRRWLV